MNEAWQDPPENFSYILFERVDPARNEQRFYYLAYLPTLVGPAVVRVYGRKNGAQRVVAPLHFASLAEAWPTLRKHIRTRLRHGYRVVGPAAYRGAGSSQRDQRPDTGTE
jgi:predicted DNA-binding WGR domain protein